MLKVYAKELEIKRPYEIKAKKTVYEVDIDCDFVVQFLLLVSFRSKSKPQKENDVQIKEAKKCLQI